MLHADIVILERRSQLLEREIFEASNSAQPSDLLLHDLRSKALFVREEIERLRLEALSH
jgi:hypothetical protein